MTGKPDRKKNKEGKRRSSAALFCNIFGTVMLVALVLVCLPLTVPRLFGYHIYTVISGSMEPAIPTGSLVYIQEMEPEDVKDAIESLDRCKAGHTAPPQGLFLKEIYFD